MGGDGGKIVVEQVEPAGVGPVFVQVGQNGLASGGLVGEGEGDLGLLYQLHLTVGDDHGSLSLRAGFINAVLNGDAQRHAGGGSKEVGIDGAQHVVAQALGIADRQIDGAGPVGGAGCLEEDGLHLPAVRREFQGEALHPARGGVAGDGVGIGQAVSQLPGGAQLGGACGGVGRGQCQQQRQRQGGEAAGSLGEMTMFHGYSFSHG